MPKLSLPCLKKSIYFNKTFESGKTEMFWDLQITNIKYNTVIFQKY